MHMMPKGVENPGAGKGMEEGRDRKRRMMPKDFSPRLSINSLREKGLSIESVASLLDKEYMSHLLAKLELEGNF